MSDEQRVRTMAGWVGVEISKSRVRTRGKAGYGLYRVRGQDRPSWSEPYRWERWTAYAFTLEEIEREIQQAIAAGIPARPADLWLLPDPSYVAHAWAKDPPAEGSRVAVTTRWTSAYRGRRDLGVSKAERAGTRALAEQLTTNTVRSRQRVANAEFQREHKVRRDWGLAQRHARKAAHNARSNNQEGR